ncbi:MAG: TrmH family RNA methyltransferase [Paramuribaculum sp.]|nr:TrmH family RNA methyltransferase [Paramuribaculum sp.]
MDKKTIWDLGRDTVEVFRAKPKMPLVVVLDNVRSLNNIGSIFRTSDAFLVERIMLCGITACPPSPEIHKTALGAEESVSWEYYESTDKCLEALHDAGYVVCVLEQVKGSIELQDFVVEPDKKYALVAGHEVHGVSQSAVDSADYCIEIPQFGTKHSLNVSVSVALGIWHFFTGK